MSSKSRVLRVLAVVLPVVAFAGYFLFATFLFSPFEGGLDADIAALVPRKVDFFVAKSGLGTAFDGFPRLKAMDALERTDAWTTFVESPEYAEFASASGLEQAKASLEELVAELPLGLEPQEIFGGGDLAIAGTFRGKDLAQADWAIYGDVAWAGKLAVAMLRYPGLIGLEKQGLEVAKEADWVVLSGGQLVRPVCIARIRDVVIVSSQPELVRAAFDLRTKSYQDSLHQSAPYFDHIQNAERSARRDEFEIALDLAAMRESFKLPGNLPDAKSQDFLPAFLGKYFQLGAVKDVVGVLGVDDGLVVNLHGTLSPEVTTPVQDRFYRTRGIDRGSLLGEAACLAPADTCFFLYLRGDIGDLLRQILLSLEPATRDLLEDTFRNTGQYATLEQLVTDLDGALKDRLALIVRPNDYPDDPQGPPHNDDPVFAVALILWTQEVQKIVDLRELIGRNGARFGLKGRNPGEPGYFRNTVEGGFEVREFWSEFVPGTGVIATVNAGELTIAANSFQMLGHILKTYTQGETRYPRLSEDGQFLFLANNSLSRANAILWVNPGTAAETLRRQARRWAEGAIQIDWKQERARVEDRILRERHSGAKRATLAPEVQTELDELVDQELGRVQAQVRAEQVPAAIARWERWIRVAEAVPGALAVLALDPRSFDLSLRLPVELAAE